MEFIISDFISLKIENGKTSLYVNGKLFNQCKYPLLEILEKKNTVKRAYAKGS